MNGYIVFFEKKRFPIYAETSYDAVKQAIAVNNIPKSKQHMVCAKLVEKAYGVPVVHSTSSI